MAKTFREMGCPDRMFFVVLRLNRRGERGGWTESVPWISDTPLEFDEQAVAFWSQPDKGEWLVYYVWTPLDGVRFMALSDGDREKSDYHSASLAAGNMRPDDESVAAVVQAWYEKCNSFAPCA